MSEKLIHADDKAALNLTIKRAHAPGATDESCPEWDHVVQAHACCADSAAAAAAACAACEPTSWRALPPPRCVYAVHSQTILCSTHYKHCDHVT